MNNEIDKKTEGDVPCATPASNTPELFSEAGNGAAYIPRSRQFGNTCLKVFPELTGKRWGDAALALVTGLRPTSIRVVENGCCFDSYTGRVTVWVKTVAHGIKLIRYVEMEMSFELVASHLDSGYDTMRKLQEYCNSCGQPIKAKFHKGVVEWSHSHNNMIHCDEEDTIRHLGSYIGTQFAEPTPKPVLTYREPTLEQVGYCFGSGMVAKFLRSKVEITEDQIRTALADIRAIAAKHSYDLTAIEELSELPKTRLHSYLYSSLKPLYLLKLAIVPGRTAREMTLISRNCLDSSIELCAGSVMEMQEKGLLLHWMLR